MCESSPSSGPLPGWFGHLVGPAFLLLAAWLLYGPPPTRIPSTGIHPVAAEVLTSQPRRQTIGDPPTIEIGGFARTCGNCHALFPLGETPRVPRVQHTHIELQHGINDQCRNCHDVRDMNRLVLYSGEAIAFAEVTQLCQKCHGLEFRDWQRGIHGRVNDYWNPDLGEPRKLRCIECHDPHRPRVPAMDPLPPLPGPNTLRMGRPGHGEAVVGPEENDPLRRSLTSPETASNKEHR